MTIDEMREKWVQIYKGFPDSKNDFEGELLLDFLNCGYRYVVVKILGTTRYRLYALKDCSTWNLLWVLFNEYEFL